MTLNFRILIGVVLVIAGILAVIYGGFSYTSDTHSADLGPIELSISEQERVNIPLWAGVAAILVGVATLSFGRLQPPSEGKTT